MAASTATAQRPLVARAGAPAWVERLAASITIETAVYVALTLVALGMRLLFLGDKPLHHDESLHATFTWQLFVGKGYHYDPMMHGPFQFLVTTGIFYIVGVSDFTTRLLPAILGTVIVPLPYLLRRELGRVGALFASLALMISPSFLYFSRFYRNDIYIACFTLGLVICYLRFLRERRGGWVVGALALLALSFTSKEITFITSFVFGTYILIVLGCELSGRFEPELLRAVRAVGGGPFVNGLAVFALIFTFFFTTAFTWWPGLVDGLTKSLEYWLSQLPVARGSEPWWYYWSLLLPYEPALVLLAVGGTALAFIRRSRFVLLLVWWAVVSMLVYTWASEKMPWLVLHMLLPILLLAAVAVQWLYEQRASVWRTGVGVILAAGMLYMLHAAIALSYDHPADPEEMLVYTQTSPDVQLAVSQVQQVQLRSGLGTQMPIVVDPEDWWPLTWYLRDQPGMVSGLPQQGANYPLYMVSDQNITNVEPFMASNYVEEHLKLRVWWIPDWSKQSVANWWNWVLYRQPWNPEGSTDFYVFIRRDLASGL